VKSLVKICIKSKQDTNCSTRLKVKNKSNNVHFGVGGFNCTILQYNYSDTNDKKCIFWPIKQLGAIEKQIGRIMDIL
jgi:hypothetical protein